MEMYLRADHIETLWVKMAMIYGHKWVSGYGESDDGTWLRGLQDLTPGALAKGLEACLHRLDIWPPTLPEFRLLCLGLPDITTTIGNVMNNFSDPVANLIRAQIGSWDLQRMSFKQIELRVKQIYPTVLLEVTQNMVKQTRNENELLTKNKSKLEAH